MIRSRRLSVAGQANLGIGELGRATGTKVTTIRFYEQQGLLREPRRSAAGRRQYGNADRQRLAFIRRSRSLGFPIDAVRELLALSDDTSRSCKAVDTLARAHLAEIDQKIADLMAMRTELDRVIGSCRRGTIADCKIIETLGP
ncbi:MAG: MerR family transcriptional regulator [Sphingomonadaceae bacterium]|nr:MerR family transcriptional regulator [Sphingomonadaceae bacterium]